MVSTTLSRSLRCLMVAEEVREEARVRRRAGRRQPARGGERQVRAALPRGQRRRTGVAVPLLDRCHRANHPPNAVVTGHTAGTLPEPYESPVTVARPRSPSGGHPGGAEAEARGRAVANSRPAAGVAERLPRPVRTVLVGVPPGADP